MLPELPLRIQAGRRRVRAGTEPQRRGCSGYRDAGTKNGMSGRKQELGTGAIDLSGRVALVTGGGRSIGATICLVLARDLRWLGIPILAKRRGEPEDVAHAVAFFASDAAEYVTGQSLHVSGGLFMP